MWWAGGGMGSTGSGGSAKAEKAVTQPMGHSAQPMASTSAEACAAAIRAAEGGASAALPCSVERRGGCRSTCPTMWSMIWDFLPWSLAKPCM